MKKSSKNKLQDQLNEDREKIVEAYESLRSMIVSLQDYALTGQTLVKFAELLTKQTSQLIEIHKIESKKDTESETFSEDELEELKNDIDKIVRIK